MNYHKKQWQVTRLVGVSVTMCPGSGKDVGLVMCGGLLLYKPFCSVWCLAMYVALIKMSKTHTKMNFKIRCIKLISLWTLWRHEEIWYGCRVRWHKGWESRPVTVDSNHPLHRCCLSNVGSIISVTYAVSPKPKKSMSSRREKQRSIFSVLSRADDSQVSRQREVNIGILILFPTLPRCMTKLSYLISLWLSFLVPTIGRTLDLAHKSVTKIKQDRGCKNSLKNLECG